MIFRCVVWKMVLMWHTAIRHPFANEAVGEVEA